MRTKEEINEQLDKAENALVSGEGYFGMTYEAGVKAAIEWIMGDVDEKPIE